MKKIKIFLFLLLIVIVLFSCKNSHSKSKPVVSDTCEQITASKDTLFGIDFSHWQGNVNWKKLEKQTKHLVSFFIFRATLGDAKKDTCFVRNFTHAKKSGKFKAGSYHFYYAMKDPRAQTRNYLDAVGKIQGKGDFIPILDVEELPDTKILSMEKWKENIKLWLRIVEKHFGVKPLLYVGVDFYERYLMDDFSDYKRWISATSLHRRKDPLVKESYIFQFSLKITIPGIIGPVDGNDIDKRLIDSLILK